MPNGDTISKLYTLEQAVNRALSRLDIKDPEGNIIYKVIQEINVKQKEIAKSYREKDENVKSQYEQAASLTFTGGECTWNQVEIANPLVVEPLRVDVYKAGLRVGEVPYLNPSAFSNLPGNTFYDNALICTFRGRSVNLFAGPNLDATQFTFKFIYTREVNTLLLKTDYLDLPNSAFDDLVKEIELLLQTEPKETEENKE